MQALQFHNTKYYLEKNLVNKYPFSKISSQWTQIFPNVMDLVYYASCLFKSRLYILGGFLQTLYRLDYPSFDRCSDCWAFDQSGDEIDGVGNMLMARHCHSCVVFDGKIVVTGGISGTEGSVEAYDHHLNEWTYMPDLLEQHYSHGSVAMGNKFYVIGGEGTQSCEVFDKVSNKFARIKQFPRAMTFAKVEVFRVQNEIIVKLDEKDENVIIYDTITDKWTSMSVNMFNSLCRNSIIYKF